MEDIEVCEKSPIREHLDIVDIEDRRFHICKWCGRTKIRTDPDYIKDIGPMDKLRGDEEDA